MLTILILLILLTILIPKRDALEATPTARPRRGRAGLVLLNCISLYNSMLLSANPLGYITLRRVTSLHESEVYIYIYTHYSTAWNVASTTILNVTVLY